jgi:undecaprenyl-diphosphatase
VDFVAYALLGLIQGLTEFLPVSSDGHLAIAGLLYGGTADLSLGGVVLLHLGTLVATLIVFREDVGRLLRSTAAGLRAPSAFLATPDGRVVRTVVVASVPTAAIGLGLHDAVEAWADVAWIVGACLLLTAACVGSTRVTEARATKDEPSLGIGPALVLGIAQGLAVLPGLSRSGTTIACAILLGLRAPAAFRLSFLLALPAVGGAVLLELRHPEVWSAAGMPGIVGAIVALVSGLGAALALRGLVASSRFWWFAPYCLVLGVALVGWDLAT